MSVIYQQNLVDRQFPYNIFLTEIQDYPPHWHEEYEIIYNLDEPFQLGIGEDAVTLNTGDIYIVEPRVIHSFWLQRIPRKRFILQYMPRGHAQYSYDKLSKPHLTKKDGKIYSTLLKLLQEICDEYEDKIDGYEYAIMSKVYEIATLIIRDMDKIGCTLEEVSLREKRISRLQKVFDYIDGHYQKKITLDDIAEVADYSTYYFTRFFKETTGMTFNDYLSNYRVVMATMELMLTDESITDISMNVGFNSVKTFNRVFKKFKCLSPSAYREAVRK